ncbi:sensor histidine kinase [Streptomyces sp. NPDC093109]|uniref:sensor histidine kinase n=1 Tax=Streptomyces sp. NPDC093109 TaxID=3154977 RepID=UPI00344BA755
MIDSLQRQLRDHPRTVDAAMAVALFACSFPGSMITLPGRPPGPAWWPGVLLAGVSCAALLWRRDHPRTTVALTTACAVAITALGYIVTVLLLGALLVALYSLAGRAGRRTANTCTLAVIALLAGTALIGGPTEEPLVLKLVGPAAWLLLPTSLGTVGRIHAAYLDAVRARAEHAERTREEETRHRVTEERVHIARELHDVVAHHLVLAHLQAGAAARAIRTRPDEAERIVGELAGSTSSAIRELKAVVGLLRQADDPERPPEPAPGLDRLPGLASSFRGAGLTVTVVTEGPPAPLSPGADLTAYRIVQEALTNVTKHAATDAAEVRLAYGRDRLDITVADDGGTAAPAAAPPVPASAPPPGGGYGLIGMRERALAAGGRLRAGHRPGGGFDVVVELPLHR